MTDKATTKIIDLAQDGGAKVVPIETGKTAAQVEQTLNEQLNK